MKITEGLPGKCTAVQMHLHWGGWDLEASGADHAIDGIRYMAEVGLQNTKTFFHFIKHFVLFSFQDGHFENTYYSDFIANLKKIKYAGELLTKTNKQKKKPTLLYLGSESKCDL
uniref:Alpha-carbonic anhydrase domain-containing protein n=1 Tax=Pundamilia nyererei TaxID=303518 RepID=A0A3B4FBT4_9CICH